MNPLANKLLKDVGDLRRRERKDGLAGTDLISSTLEGFNRVTETLAAVLAVLPLQLANRRRDWLTPALCAAVGGLIGAAIGYRIGLHDGVHWLLTR